MTFVGPSRIFAGYAVLASFAAPAVCLAQEQMVTVELRVISARPGSATVDRGRVDGLRRGDRVIFRPRDGVARFGTVSRVEGRASIVDLEDSAFVPAAGTRGEASVPNSRFDVVDEPAVEAPIAGEPMQGEPAPVVEHPPWPERDDSWAQGQPLLARVRPLRPNQRPADVRGRFYSIADFTHSTEDSRTDGFYRAGAEVTIENRYGRGERLHFDGELNFRHTDVPDNDDETSTHLRIDRASYAVGGHRFDADRLEFGRFLQDNLPEFGVVDGVEWDRRLDGGDRIGFSAGFMPEPNADQETIQDFQVSASYRWVYDESEQLSAAAGFQKTLHDADADRDLFVAQLRYLPLSGWTFSGTAWIDYYSSGDTAKGEGVEVTQAYVHSAKRWGDGSLVRVGYHHSSFPEIDRNEFLPVTVQQLADDRDDRVSVESRVAASKTVQLHGLIAGWADQDDSGGDGEVGIRVDRAFSDRLSIDVTGFATEGKFVSLVGARAAFRRSVDQGLWSLEYELVNNRFDGFSGDNNDLPEHRVRLSADHYTSGGWTISGHLDGMVWDNETSITVGFYLQRSF